MKKRRWLWVTLFIAGIALLGILAAGWNLLLVRDHLDLVELAEKLPQPPDLKGPWWNIVLGSTGFLAAIAGFILFFLKIRREERLNQAQSEFLASVSHELKTPLATLELCGSLLRMGATKDEQGKLWSSFDGDLKRLREQVDMLLEAARWQAHEDHLQPESIEVESWLQESLSRWKNMLGPEAELKRVGEPLKCSANLDPRALNLIFDNLVDNARKFARGSPKVTVRSELKNRSWILSIADEGWGFRPEDSEKLFRRFSRGRAVAPYSIPGTGLGLFLAASASKALGLRLHGVSDGLGRGATFRLQGKAER